MIRDPSEFRRGWRVLLASSLGVACGASPIPLYAIGVLAVPLTEEFGWGRADVMLAILPLTLALVVSVPFIGALADRIGVRPVVLGALAGFGVTWASLALLPGSLAVYYAMWFLIGLVGGGSTPVGWTRGVVGWFVANRGLALGITLIGTGITGLLLPPYAAWLIENFGWRNAFLGMALLPLGLALPVAWKLFYEAPGTGPARGAGWPGRRHCRQRRGQRDAGGRGGRDAARGHAQLPAVGTGCGDPAGRHTDRRHRHQLRPAAAGP
jgi:MFS family permease